MNHTLADFRSDTVTQPCQGMRAAMAAAEVGDDVFGDDPTINRLEATVADMAGKEAALFCPTGTQSNLTALLSHCQRGDEYIVGQEAHTYKYEGGGAAVLGGIQPQPIDFQPDRTLDLVQVAAVIKPDDSHFARSRLLCLENTCSGYVLPAQYHARAASFCRERGLAIHLDGARLFNACVAQQLPLAAIAQHYDTVSLCLSKGLGAPAGSVLVGSAAQIRSARRWRKVLGGGMRQAGVLAAAGLYALEHNVERLAEDHRRARQLAEGLAEVKGLHCNPADTHTNMVWARVQDPARAAALPGFLAQRGIRILGGDTLRLVTHRDIDDAAIAALLAACREYFG